MQRQEICNALDSLISTIGIKPQIALGRFNSTFRPERPDICAERIAEQLGLPVKINLSYAPKEYVHGGSATFSTRDLVRTDWRGRGTETIFAQVGIPGLLPLYGTAGLTNFLIKVRISEASVRHPLVLTTALAHELSHVLLQSLKHPQRDNEVWTDLTAMLMGFAEIMTRGRKITLTRAGQTRDVGLGYLSDNEFAFAQRYISTDLTTRQSVRRRLLDGLNSLRCGAAVLSKLLTQFSALIGLVDQHRGRGVKKADVPRIVALHRPDYAREFELEAEETKRLIAEAGAASSEPHNYSDAVMNSLKECATRVHSAHPRISRLVQILRNDVRTLRKNLPLALRLRSFLGVAHRPPGPRHP